MKYSIDELEDGIVIESIKKNNKRQTLTVNYLNGKKDVHEFTEEKMKAIIDIMEEQAKSYVESSSPKISNLEKINKFVKCLGLSSGIIFFLSALTWIFDIPFAASYYLLSILTSGSAVLVSKIMTKKIEDVKKYEMFLNETAEILPEYRKIVDNEFAISKSIAPVPLFDISCLDKCTLEQLKQIKNKVERYRAVEPNVESFSALDPDDELGHQKTLKK